MTEAVRERTREAARLVHALYQMIEQLTKDLSVRENFAAYLLVRDVQEHVFRSKQCDVMSKMDAVAALGRPDGEDVDFTSRMKLTVRHTMNISTVGAMLRQLAGPELGLDLELTLEGSYASIKGMEKELAKMLDGCREPKIMFKVTE